ncbi:hypothetical protein AB1Y20_012952 [Prymnesium parvum]|uniref:Cyclin-Q n=1 Tax=Prymnesium parvum TaxID=97485 RepID=A0AB34IM35_PRYPA
MEEETSVAASARGLKAGTTLRTAAIMLNISDSAVFSALHFWHEFGRLRTSADAGPARAEEALLAACLLLASKVEEEPRRIRDVINCVQFAFNGEKLHNPHRYWEKKERVLLLEQQLLRALAFDTAVEQPLFYLLHYLSAAGASPAWCELSVCLANDCCASADCALRPARLVAAAALGTAAALLGKELPPQWHAVLGVEFGSLQEVSKAMLEVYTHTAHKTHNVSVSAETSEIKSSS